MSGEYRVIFSGEIVEGADPAQVRDNFRKLFKADDVRIEKLFCGRRVAIKNNVDEATARKYRKAITRAGGVCHVELMGGARETSEPAPNAPAASGETPPAVAAAQGGAAAMPSRSWRLEAPGADLRDPDARREAPPPPDTGDLSMAEAGADILEQRAARPVFEADLSGMTVAPPGAELVSERAEKPVFRAELDELSMAPPGAELLPDTKKDKPPPPDPGDLELVK